MNRRDYDDRIRYQESSYNPQRAQKSPKKKTKKALKKGVLIAAIAFLGIALGAGVALAYFKFINPQDSASYVPPSVDGETEQASNRVTFLLIGVDDRDGHRSTLTDTLILASADPDTKIISLMSIPRDTAVLGHTKINAVAASRGLDGLIKIVGELTGVKIDGYVKTNFDGFKDIIDTLGGIDIYVEKDMYKETGDQEDGVINLKKGSQLLDGTHALQYARYRNDIQGDITRTARQQKVIMAMAKKALSSESIGKLPQLVPQAAKAVETNLGLNDLLKLASMAKSFKSENMMTATLPGQNWKDEYGVSLWKVDATLAKQTVANLFKGISSSRAFSGPDIDDSPGLPPVDEEDPGVTDPGGTTNPGGGTTDPGGGTTNPGGGTTNPGGGTTNPGGGTTDPGGGTTNPGGGTTDPGGGTTDPGGGTTDPGGGTTDPGGGTTDPGGGSGGTTDSVE